MSFRTRFLGTQIGVPDKIVTNFDLEKIVDTSNEWIVERTGIKERRIADSSKNEFTSDLVTQAVLKLLDEQNFDKNQIDAIIVCTSSPDYLLPNTACIVQNKLELKNNCAAFDLVAACSGFVYGVTVADGLIKSGHMKNIIVAGAEVLNTCVDWTDRRTCILFGDGCGAALLTRADETEKGSEILSSTLGSDGSGYKDLWCEIGGRSTPFSPENVNDKGRYIQMNGPEIFKLATRALVQNAKEALELANISPDEVDWVVPHQANLRIIQAVNKRFNIPEEKTIINIDRYGNTSAASIPLAFHEAIADGRIKRGDIVMLNAFGAGVTSGCVVLRY